MSNKSPIFPMPEPHHFNDYGFDPQIHYFQVLEESRKHKKETSSTAIDSLQFKLQKPISKDDQCSKKSNHPKSKIKKCWWRNVLFFCNRKKWSSNDVQALETEPDGDRARGKASRCSISGPVYMTETSRSGLITPYRTTSRSSSGPLAGISTPYHSLRELNMEQEQYRVSTSSMPIYLVT